MKQKLLRMALVILPLVVTTLVAPPSIASSADGLNVIEKPYGQVPANLKWKADLLASAEAKLKLQKRSIVSFLNIAKATGGTLLVVSPGKKLEFGDVYNKYKFMEPYGHSVKVEMFGSWGASLGKRTIGGDIVPGASAYFYMATLPVGTCRISFDLWNWNTWAVKDCAPKVASPADYLRARLIEWVYNSPVTHVSVYFEALIGLKTIANGHSDYKIVDGRIVSSAFMEPIDSIPLVSPPGPDYSGYEIKIDPNNKWHIDFYLTPITFQSLVDVAHWEQMGSEKFLVFRAQ